MRASILIVLVCLLTACGGSQPTTLVALWQEDSNSKWQTLVLELNNRDACLDLRYRLRGIARSTSNGYVSYGDIRCINKDTGYAE